MPALFWCGSMTTHERLIQVTLDESSLGRGSPDVEHERRTAIYDLIEENVFIPHDLNSGPYGLNIGLADGRLMLQINHADGQLLMSHYLALGPFRRLIRDYFMICESYYEAIRHAPLAHIEAIDMGRRGVHNEAADVLIERLKGKIEVDHATARRLFTLIAALHWRG